MLPIGGLKEKALAAQAAGILRVIAPKLNEQDIEDIPEHLRKDIDLRPAQRPTAAHPPAPTRHRT